MSDIEFGNNLTKRTSVKGEKERAQYGALGDSERENYHLKLSPILTFFVYGLKGKI